MDLTGIQPVELPLPDHHADIRLGNDGEGGTGLRNSLHEVTALQSSRLPDNHAIKGKTAVDRAASAIRRFSILVGLVVSLPTLATAAEFVLATPNVNAVWGRQENDPIGPSSLRATDLDFTGADSVRTYESAMLASTPTLDEAAAYHWYEIAPASLQAHGIAPKADLIGPQVQQALRSKQEEAQPRLIEELDARFRKLTDALERADNVVLPLDDQPGPVGHVAYCNWIRDAAQYSLSPLGKTLFARCVQDRDVFIEKMVRRLAELAPIPDLPSSSGSEPIVAAPNDLSVSGLHASTGLRDLGSTVILLNEVQLPRSVLPGDLRASLSFAPLAQSYERALRTRFEASRGRLLAQLTQALERHVASDVMRSPQKDCRPILGQYAGFLLQATVSAAVAKSLNDACVDALSQQVASSVGRIKAAIVAQFDAMTDAVNQNRTGTTRVHHAPNIACRVVLQQYFPGQTLGQNAGRFAPGLDPDQAADLQQTCITAATRVNVAVVAKHVTDVIARAEPGPNTLAAWEASAWSPGYMASFDWIDREDPFVAGPTIASFQAAYETAMAPKRKVAAEHWFGEIERAFTVETGIESAAAGKLCSGHYHGTGNDIVNAWFGFQPDVAAVQRNISLIRGKPGLSAQDAQYWIAETCRGLHERTIERRISMATDAAAVSGTFAKGARLAVRSPEGELKQVDPEALVKAAAVDGLQVVVTPGGMFSAPGMRVRPFGQTAPVLDGKLKKATRGDGVEVLEVVGLPSLPELDGPMATVECLGTPVQEAFTQGQARMLQGYVGAIFGGSPTGGLVAENARRTMLDVQACDAAKTAFKRLAVAP